MIDELLETLKAIPPERLQDKLWESRHRITHEWVSQLAETFGEITANEGLEAAHQAARLYAEIARFAATTFQDSFFHAWELKFKGLIACCFEGQNAEALELLSAAIEIFEQYHREGNSGLAYTYEDLAEIYRRKGEYNEAIKYYRKAIEIREILKDSLSLASNQHLLGKCLISIGACQEAMSPLEQAAEGFQQHERFLELTMCLNDLGLACASMGEYRKAIQYLTRAIELNEQHGLLVVNIRLLAHLAQVYIQINRFDVAKELLDRALSLAHLLRNVSPSDIDSEIASIQLHLGAIAYKIHDIRHAQVYISEVLELCNQGKGSEKVVATFYNNFAVISLCKAQRETSEACRRTLCFEAIEHLKNSMDIWHTLSDKREIALTYTGVGLAFVLLEEYQGAKASYEQALTTCKEGDKITHPEVAWVALHGMGKAFERMNEYEQALAKYKEAIALIETTRQGLTEDSNRLSFLDDKMIVYRDAIALTLLLCKTRRSHSEIEAMELIEHSKSRTLLEIMQRRVKNLWK